MKDVSLPHPELVKHRLTSQRLNGNQLATAAEVVAWMGGVQSQDFAGAKWGVGQRTFDLSDADVSAAFDRGEILRTHVLRPTWHFVTPADIRWLLDVTSRSIRTSLLVALSKAGVETADLAWWRQRLVSDLEGGNALTRDAIYASFADHGRPISGQPGGYLLMLAEVDQLICSGPLQGNKHTYMLLDERAPIAAPLSREEALAELAIRYFQSHGPGTEHDLAWWSDLGLVESREAIALAGDSLDCITMDGARWYHGAISTDTVPTPHVRLVPAYDEYFSRNGLRQRYPGPTTPRLEYMLADRFTGHHVLVDGLLRGSWKRTVTRKLTNVKVELFAPVTPSESDAIAVEAERIAVFLGLPLELQTTID